MKTSSVEWRALECVKQGQMSRIYPSPVSGLTDFPRMCRRRSASIPVVAYVVDIGPRYRSLIIPRFSFFTRVPSCIQNDSIRGCSTGRLIGKIIARGKRRGIISEGYIRKLSRSVSFRRDYIVGTLSNPRGIDAFTFYYSRSNASLARTAKENKISTTRVYVFSVARAMAIGKG